MTETLAAFLANPARPAGTLRYHELQGFLFAVVSAPELIPPSEWMPMVFDEAEAGYADFDEANRVINEFMSLYNTVNGTVIEGSAALPSDCVFREAVLANLDADAPVSQWARGFMRGHQWLEDLWESYVPEELDEESAAVLLTLTFFASPEIAEAFRKESATDESLEALATTIRRIFPKALAEYAHLGRSIAQALAEHATPDGARRRSARTGRNDPCPCGSGRKYKKCCGASAH